MQSTNMQPLSGKELEYIVDSISNEELLLKQCAPQRRLFSTQPSNKPVYNWQELMSTT